MVKLIGQKKIKEILKRSLQRKRMPHALLFHGDEGVGKEAMALELARALICQQGDTLACNQCSDCRRIAKLSHPDMIFIFPMPKNATKEDQQDIIKSIIKNPYLRTHPWANPNISIDQIRELKKASMLTSFENKGRVVIIADAHRLTTEAANSLLKILEEPPPNMNIILTSSHPNLLLSTITSRCQALRFDPLSWQEIKQALEEQMNVVPEKAQLISKLSFGSYRRALELLEEELEQKQEKVLDVLRTIIRSELDSLLLVEQLVRKNDKRSIKELLVLLLLWFRDALIYVEGGGNNNLIVNIDRLETLDKFCNSFEKLNFDKIVSEIEKSIDLFDKNVYVNLILINLFYNLKHNLRRKNV